MTMEEAWRRRRRETPAGEWRERAVASCGEFGEEWGRARA
jgi:hypothetical protein